MADANPLDEHLAFAAEQLRRALAELEQARQDPAQLHTALLALGAPLHAAAHWIHAAAQQLGVAPEFVEWLTGVVVRPPEPTSEAAQAAALMTWLMSRLETVPSRVRTALGRDLTRIIAGEGGALVGLDSAGLMAELARPGGGCVGKVGGLGSAGLVVLREALGVEVAST